MVYQRMMQPDLSFVFSGPPPILSSHQNPTVSRGYELAELNLADKVRSEARQVFTKEMVAAFSDLFARFVHPYLPIVSKSDLINNTDVLFETPALLFAIAATARHFVTYDEQLCLKLAVIPSAELLYRLCWKALQAEIAAPSLDTVQALILLLHRHVPDELSFEGAMDSNLRGLLVSSAHILGLNHDPGNWTSIPLGQRKLRKRTWWATLMTEKWMAFSDGMPSQLGAQDQSVLPLDDDDLDDGVEDFGLSSHRPSPFIYMTRLTLILDEVVQSFFTAAASATTSKSLDRSLDIAKSLRSRLKEWDEALPPGLQVCNQNPSSDAEEVTLNGNYSLYLAYITVHLAIYRALLRPISLADMRQDDSAHMVEDMDSLDSTAVGAVFEGAAANLKKLVTYVSSLPPAAWDAFWPGCKPSASRVMLYTTNHESL
ncbi:unnamed protein product [Clonostachys rosea]|uniref:Xylanolytic transcriptional activator regulatory domain-containing protein n=1 Tax=Bionectria ochroleuca TaxID=29856 RepID=A0ABY6UKA1_BIOOC|nr:unnamed protein product [Clonostachys rosea]